MEVDSISTGRVLKVRTHVESCHGDASPKTMSCGQRFEHRGREIPALGTMAGPQFRHGPRQLSQRQHFDVVGQRDETSAEQRLQLC